MTVLPFRPRPRGKRKIAPARQRAIRDPYNAEHRRRRAAAIAWLAATGGWECPGGCGRWLHAGMGRQLHLHHSGGLAQKLAGLPGDTLMCAGCNRSAGGREGAKLTNQRKTVTASKTAASKTVPAMPDGTVRQSREW